MDLPFQKFIERRARCQAIVLNEQNVLSAAQALMYRGWEVNVRMSQGGSFIEAKRDDEAFVADVDNGDALVTNGYDDLEYVPALAFRKQWEREENT